MSLYVFAPAAAGAPAGCAGAVVAGAPPQLASMASASSAAIIVEVTLEAVIDYSFLVVIVHSARGLSCDGSQTSHSVIRTSFTNEFRSAIQHLPLPLESMPVSWPPFKGSSDSSAR